MKCTHRHSAQGAGDLMRWGLAEGVGYQFGIVTDDRHRYFGESVVEGALRVLGLVVDSGFPEELEELCGRFVEAAEGGKDDWVEGCELLGLDVFVLGGFVVGSIIEGGSVVVRIDRDVGGSCACDAADIEYVCSTIDDDKTVGLLLAHFAIGLHALVSLGPVLLEETKLFGKFEDGVDYLIVCAVATALVLEEA